MGENSGWETYFLSGLFAIVGALHIPLIFYVGKESMLIIIFTAVYTNDDEIEGENADVSQISASQFGGNEKSKLLNNPSHQVSNNNQATRSELNRTNNRSVMKKTSVIPNIDVSITRQVLAVNPATSMLRNGGIQGYETDLKAQDANQEPSHKDMPNWIYYSVTLGIYAVNVTLACILDDVSIVFGFIGALSISMLFFILPGLFYLRAVYLSTENGVIWRKLLSYVYIVLGFMLMFGGIAAVIVKVIEDGKDDAEIDPEDL